MCAGLLNLKCYFLMLPPGMVEREAAHLVHTPDVIVPDREGPFPFAGAEFRILQTPGHSAGHICVVTPDNVCYVGDCLLSREMMDSKLPYCLSHQMGMESRERMRGLPCDKFIMAHRGIARREELDRLIDDNQALALRRAGEILSLIPKAMTMSEINQAVCAYYKLLTGKPRRALRFERNIRFFVEFLTDRGDLVMETDATGTTVYRPA